MIDKIPTETEQVKPETDMAEFYKKECQFLILQLQRAKSVNRDLANSMIVNHSEIVALKGNLETLENKLNENAEYVVKMQDELQDLRLVLELERDEHAETKNDLKAMQLDRDGWKNAFVNGKEMNKQVHPRLRSVLNGFFKGGK